MRSGAIRLQRRPGPRQVWLYEDADIPVHIQKDVENAQMAMEPDHAIAHLMATRSSLISSALDHVSSSAINDSPPSPATVASAREARAELMQIQLHSKQKQVRAGVEHHLRNMIRERSTAAPFRCLDVSMHAPNQPPCYVPLLNSAAFIVRPTFFEADKEQIPIESIPPLPDSNYVPRTSASSNQSFAVPVVPPIEYPLSSCEPITIHNTFTSNFTVPSLRKQLPPPVVPTAVPSSLIHAKPSKPIIKKNIRLATIANPSTFVQPPSASPAAADETSVSPALAPPSFTHPTVPPALQPTLLKVLMSSTQTLSSQMQVAELIAAQLQQLRLQIVQQHQERVNHHLIALQVNPALSPLQIQQLAEVHASQLTKEDQLLQMQQQMQAQQLAALYQIYSKRSGGAVGQLGAIGFRPMSAAALAAAKYSEKRKEKAEADAARQLQEKERKDKIQLRKLFLNTVKKHREDFIAIHRKRRAQVGKMARECFRVEQNLEKEKAAIKQKEEKAESKEAEARLAALKANDMAAYEALIKSCKSKRIEQLLEQTTQWEAKLKAMVAEKRRAGKREERLEREKEEQKERDRKEQEDTTMEDASSETANAHSASSLPPASSSIQSKSDAPADADAVLDEDLLELEEEKVTQPSMMVGGELKPYQLVGIQWLTSLYNNHLNGILADEMGLGKTIQAIGILSHLFEKKKVAGPFLVIAPLSTIKNWRSEFDRWTPDMKVVTYIGNKDERLQLWRTSLVSGAFHVVLTTYEYVMSKRDVAKLGAINWKYLIIDEGHRLKNHQSKLAVTLAERYRAPHRLILSGTPLQNELGELWSLLNFLLPTIFDSRDSFKSWFSKPFEKQGIRAAAETTDTDELLNEEEKLLIIRRLHSILRPFLLRRMKVDVATQLPPKVEFLIKCSLTAWQKKVYERIRDRVGLNEVGSQGEVRAKRMANMFMQLRKIVNHPYLFEANNPLYQDADDVANPDLVRCSGKFDLLNRIIPKLLRTGHKMLLFTQMTKILDLIEDYLNWKNIAFVRLDGHSTSEARSIAQDVFKNPEANVNLFIMSTRAGGLGLNLQMADTVILFDSDWNPQNDNQAQDRAHRLGQCWGEDTPIMMYDGTSKCVQHIKVGDQLMGDDQTVRNVLALTRGHTATDEVFHRSYHLPTTPPGMYKIVPKEPELKTWTCNGSHILVLRWNRMPSPVVSHQQETYSFTQFESCEGMVVHRIYHFSTLSAAEIAHADAAKEANVIIEVEIAVDDFRRCDPIVQQGARMFRVEMNHPPPVESTATKTTIGFEFSLSPIEHASYFGFALDGNQRCLLRDFTVTHNSREVKVFRLISISPAEEEVLKRAQNKLKMDQMVIQSGRFDKKTSSEERKGLLQGILRQSINKESEKDATPDREINRMMCRSEEEFRIFEQMDADISKEDEKLWKEFKGKNKTYPGRFITEEELPPHIQTMNIEEEDEAEKQAAQDTSVRAAKQSGPNYNDILSDVQFARCLEKGVDPAEYAKLLVERRAARRAKKERKKNHKLTKRQQAAVAQRPTSSQRGRSSSRGRSNSRTSRYSRRGTAETNDSSESDHSVLELDEAAIAEIEGSSASEFPSEDEDEAEESSSSSSNVEEEDDEESEGLDDAQMNDEASSAGSSDQSYEANPRRRSSVTPTTSRSRGAANAAREAKWAPRSGNRTASRIPPAVSSNRRSSRISQPDYGDDMDQDEEEVEEAEDERKQASSRKRKAVDEETTLSAEEQLELISSNKKSRINSRSALTSSILPAAVPRRMRDSPATTNKSSVSSQPATLSFEDIALAAAHATAAAASSYKP